MFYILSFFLLVGHFSTCQPPQIKFPTCEIARQFAEKELLEDTIKYFQFGDFSKMSPYYQIIDSLAGNMRIKIVNVSHHRPLECYYDVVKNYFRKEKGIDNIWIYLNVKTDSLFHSK